MCDSQVEIFVNSTGSAWGAVIKMSEDEDLELSGRYDGTRHAAIIIAVLESLRCIPKTYNNKIVVHSNMEIFISGADYWMKRWVKNKWLKADDTPVSNKTEWQTLYQAIQARENIVWQHSNDYRINTARILARDANTDSQLPKQPNLAEVNKYETDRHKKLFEDYFDPYIWDDDGHVIGMDGEVFGYGPLDDPT